MTRRARRPTVPRAPWVVHRQGGFIDPFSRLWLVGDRSPFRKYDPR
jgi:hypothetical protein